jgi:phosphoribosylformylglycinamidine cyclo-ligase
MMDNSASYKDAGVDIEAGERAVDLMRQSVDATRRSEVVGSIGGFSGFFDISRFSSMRRPLLATTTDGVGTKLWIAQQADRHDTVGIDLVAMTADDLVTCGAEPLFMTDYIACGKLVPEKISSIVSGIAKGCAAAGMALLGGETAEHPGVMAESDYDLAAAATGVVEADKVLGSERVEDGDVVIAMGSSGLHSNGYSLVRHVLFKSAGWALDRHVEELGRPLVDALLEPTMIYSRRCLDLMATVDVHAFAHITGGGLAGNIARVVPDGLAAILDRSSWQPPVVFDVIQSVGSIAAEEMERTFNMGVGMVAIVSSADADRALSALTSRETTAWVSGAVVSDPGHTRLVGTYGSTGTT